MKATWRDRLAAGLLLCTLAAAARASQIVPERLGVTSQGFLFVDYRLEQPFEGKVREAIRSGLPSTLSFTIEVWRQRTGWWDRLETTHESQLRVLRDLLSDQYVAVGREEVRRFQDLDSLTAAICLHRREYLPPLAPEATYYVVVTANLAPLSVEDLRELEKWLQGTIRSGDESTPGRVAGLSGTAVGLLLGFTGFGDVTVRARTESFVPDLLRRAPAPRPAAIAGGASPPRAGTDSAADSRR